MSRTFLENGDPAVQLDHRRRGLHTNPAEDVPATSPRTDHHHHRRGPLLAKLALFAVATALAVLLVRSFVVQPFAQAGDAMAPTLRAGDRMLVLKLGSGIHSGDIVVVHPPRPLSCVGVGPRVGDLALRVVAVSGETIWSRGDRVVVDGRARFGRVGSTAIRRTTLAPDHYFVMADKRSSACDSRTFGPISRSAIRGKGIAVVGRHGRVVFETL
jgi:signal peptidase I